MKDRLKFRCWDDIHREMIDLQEQDVNPYNISDIPQNNLMQCTGLKDKSDRLIFEGDIIYKKGTKNHRGEKMYSEVVWDQMYAEFNISDYNGMHRMPSNSNNIEIIGNIYENPELLERQHD